jgi:energy-coupling factor transporter ATP-binding protein EcfA2
VPDELTRSPRHSVAAPLLWDFMSRMERADGLHSVPTPILLFTGVRGSGKTELLADLRGLLGENFPHAHINGEWSFNSTMDMLALLAFKLNQQHGYGKLAFPRLVTGEIVIRPGIAVDPLDRDHARKQMAAVLADHRKVKGVLENSIRSILRSALTPVLTRGPAAGVVGKYGAVAEELLGPSADKRRERADLLGIGQEWWRHQDRGLDNDPIDELISAGTAPDRRRGPLE